MLFNSFVFLFLFLPVTLLGYFGLNRLDNKYGKLHLLLMSLIFYGYFNTYYLLIILGSIAVNFCVYKYMGKQEEPRSRKSALAFGLLFNVGIIFYYKYYDFFISNINFIFDSKFNLLHILLPLGISFFTFQQISFVIDAYYKKVGKINLLDYSLFVTFFPQLIAGPIVLHSEMLPQFAEEKNKCFNAENMAKGLMVFTMGLFKKVIIADTLGIIVDSGFAQKPLLSSLDWTLLMLSYTFQIYFDFSGYSDMAIGLGLMFNIKLPINFNSPYKAYDIVDFWKRWHMTLTRFLRTYIYFPLGGNRGGEAKTCLNIMIVFLVSGIWHGANWTFIIWGLAHGAFSVLTRCFSKPWNLLPGFLRWGITFSFVNVAWLMFRCDSLARFAGIMKVILTDNSWTISQVFLRMVTVLPEVNLVYRLINAGRNFNWNYNGYYLVVILLICTLICVLCKNAQEFKYELTVKNAIITVLLLTYSIISMNKAASFLYFNF